MKTSDIINYNAADPAYIDLHVYITTDSGNEYRFTVSKDLQQNKVWNSPTTMALDADSDFEEAGLVPDDVQQAFLAIRPQMVARLEVSK